MGNKEFDSKIRDLMEGHQELPGEGAWEAIESSLNRRRRARVVYFRRAVVASAALAASVVLFLVLNRVDIPVADTPAGNLRSVVEAPGLQTGQQNQPAVKEPPKISVTVGRRNALANNQEIEIKKPLTQNSMDSQLAIEEDATHEQAVEEPKALTPGESSKSTYQPAKYLNAGDYKTKRRKGKPSISFSTHVSPSTSNNSVSLMAMSQAQGGYAANNVVSTIQKAYVPQEVISNTKFLMPVSVGLQIQLPLSKRVSAGTGVVYSMLFSHYDAISRDETRETQQTLHYLGFPLNLYYSFMDNSKIRLYGSGGMMVEKGLYASYKVMENGVRNTNGELIDGLQWSVNAGIGAEFKANNQIGLYFDPSFAYFFDNSQPISIRTSQPLQFRFEIGLRVHL